MNIQGLKETVEEAQSSEDLQDFWSGLKALEPRFDELAATARWEVLNTLNGITASPFGQAKADLLRVLNVLESGRTSASL